MLQIKNADFTLEKPCFKTKAALLRYVHITRFTRLTRNNFADKKSRISLAILYDTLFTTIYPIIYVGLNSLARPLLIAFATSARRPHQR